MQSDSKSKGTMCKICANVFATPEAVRRFIKTGSADLCRGTREETLCLLRQITFLCIDKYNKKGPRNEIREEDPAIILHNLRRGLESTRSQSDIYRIELRYLLHADKLKNTLIDLQSFVVCTSTGEWVEKKVFERLLINADLRAR